MEIKGTAAKTIPEFVKKRHKDRYQEWLTSLPSASKQIILNGIVSNKWYPLKEAAILPTQKMGEVLYGDALKGAWECGKYSAEVGLTGIYKVYVKFSKPEHIIDRAGRIFSAYYAPSEMESTNKQNNSVDVLIKSFPEPSTVIEHRIGGWMETAMQISGCDNVKVDIQTSLTKGDKETRYRVSWS